ncbi:MAG: rod shape-determining protein, partial [Desulfuromonadales bacterium]|nr:rod shape-determining protein [Desulfuromonadales bacterium]
MSYWDWNAWRCRVAIDVGTAFCRVAAESCGIVTFPTTMSANPPLRRGVVVEKDRLVELIRPWLRKAKGLGLFGPMVLAGAPTDVQFSERKALTMALQQAGAARVQIVPEPLAAALGAGLDISSPYAQMIVDIG